MFFLYLYKFSTDEKFNDGVEEDYYLDKWPTENELLIDDDSFDDTFSEHSSEIESEEIDNDDFDT